MIVLKTQTLAMAYNELASGKEGFRVAMGNFMNAFFLYCVDDRQELLNPSLQLPEQPTVGQLGWAAFCAGAAEYLSERYDLQCPIWAFDPAYCMLEPWFIISDTTESMQNHFQETSPTPFRRRNVFCSDRIFSNAHPSSREPGNMADVQRLRQEILAALPSKDRESYLSSHDMKMLGKPRISSIVA